MHKYLYAYGWPKISFLPFRFFSHSLQYFYLHLRAYVCPRNKEIIHITNHAHEDLKSLHCVSKWVAFLHRDFSSNGHGRSGATGFNFLASVISSSNVGFSRPRVMVHGVKGHQLLMVRPLEECQCSFRFEPQDIEFLASLKPMVLMSSTFSEHCVSSPYGGLCPGLSYRIKMQ